MFGILGCNVKESSLLERTSPAPPSSYSRDNAALIPEATQAARKVAETRLRKNVAILTWSQSEASWKFKMPPNCMGAVHTTS